MARNQSSFRGCIVGGAIGDAFGWPVEFSLLNEIKRKYGTEGIRSLELSKSGIAEFTDDTQMTLFSAEGILRAETRGILKGISHVPTVVFYAYQRWLITQGYPKSEKLDWIYDGWLLNNPGLHARRAPGNTCISALAGGKPGTMQAPLNNSKGCGGVMRVAPAGLFYPKGLAFQKAAEFAAITHGHPSGYLSAGALGYLIACIVDDQELDIAVKNTLAELKKFDNSSECQQTLEKACRLAESTCGDIEAISEIGEGWVGEEAFAIAVYCVLKHRGDFEKAIITAVNHDGDSDSTGAITGNILGAYLGIQSIPTGWIEKIELKDVLVQIADDLLIGYQENPEWEKRYPGA